MDILSKHWKSAHRMHAERTVDDPIGSPSPNISMATSAAASSPTTAKATATAVPTPEPVPSPTTAKPSVPATTGPNSKYSINDDN